MTDIVVCETSVKLKKGDITAESTDAIINLNNATLDQNYGVSKAILDAAGPDVKEECKALAKLPNDGSAVTSAGNLKCRKIIHLIDIRPNNFVDSVKKALKACDKNNMATVSLPAIGTGIQKMKAESSIRLIIKGIEDYLSDPSVMTVISEIIIVVFEKDVYKKYQCFFQNYKKNYPHFWAFGKIIELVKGDITHQAVDCIVNLTFSSLNRTSGVSGAILSAAGDTVKEECKKIGSIPLDGVAITSGGKLESKHIMHIIGPTRVPDYEPSIDRILLECHKNGFTSLAIPAIGTGAASVDAEESIKAILKSILNYLSDTLIPSLETIFIIVIQENIYKKYLEVFQAQSKELQALQREERIVTATFHGAIFTYPVTWTDIGRSEFQEVVLTETSQEYKDVEAKFFKTTSASTYEVTEIKRIQNVTMWQSFTINKQAVNRKNPGQKNVRHLYHGTHADAIVNINRDGFNRVYCGKNEQAAGVYHRESRNGKYQLTYREARAVCEYEGGQLATYEQLEEARKIGFHVCAAGWLHKGRVGYPIVKPTFNCGFGKKGIIDYGYRLNKSERWDAYCYNPHAKECGGVFTEQERLIKSPGYPNEYENEQICYWHIRVNIGQPILLQFIEMDIEEDTDCMSDYLEIYDSYDDVHGFVGRFCGDMIPEDIISTGNVMTLKFLSDSSITGGGFQIKYTALEPHFIQEINTNSTVEANNDFSHHDTE